MYNQPREPQPYEDCQAKPIQELVWTSQGMDWGWGQGIKSTTHRRVEEFGYSCLQRRLTWAKKKKNWTVALWLFKDADFIFQQDLAPVHTAKSTKSWLKDHGVGVLDWPANSPDLNIENIWSIVERKMRNKRPKNADELKATVKEIWASHHLSSATNWSAPCHTELRQ